MFVFIKTEMCNLDTDLQLLETIFHNVGVLFGQDKIDAMTIVANDN